MWLSQKSNVGRKGTNGLVAVAIDKGKNSQSALKWAVDNLLTKRQTVVLIHIITKGSGHNSGMSQGYDFNGTTPKSQQIKDLFLTFHCYCTRKDIHCLDVILEDVDVAKGMTEYVSYAAIENLVLGASRTGLLRFFS